MSSLETVPEGNEGEGLAARLAEEMAAAWHLGLRPLVEEYLTRHPELAQAPEAGVRLVYEEICLREELGEEVDPQDLLERFPQWRAHLAILLDCHNLLQQLEAEGPKFPAVGEMIEGLRLQSELGRGAQGRVFLASVPTLGGRAVVLKLTPCNGQEHISLARLQHTHIAPLYWMKELPEQRLRVLCMPYLGGATLANVLKGLRDVPVERRSGLDLVKALADAEGGEAETRSPERDAFALQEYAEAICVLGACLADALHYAHARGLVHLDVKPSNVLIAADGQPMLLDFHLAREPLRPGGEAPEWFGGTPEAMSPEQRQALEAVRGRKSPPLPVDGRSDIFSLGLLLYESLSGQSCRAGSSIAPLRRVNPRVSLGLSDIIGRCMEPNLAKRYASAADVAADLRRHLAHEPLRGVPNRSFGERWRKWRLRKPHALTHAAMLLIIVTGLAGAGAAAHVYTGQRLSEAAASLEVGQQQLHQQEFASAETTLERGLDLARATPGGESLVQELAAALARARRARAADMLHDIVQRVLFLHDPTTLHEPVLKRIDANCAAVWESRALLRDASAVLPAELDRSIQNDLLDLALCWADLRLYLKQPKAALQIATEAEETFGPGGALARLRQRCLEAVGDLSAASTAAIEAQKVPAKSAWDHVRLGQAFLRAGQFDEAGAELKIAVLMEPDNFWAHFYSGLASFRRRQFDEAEKAFWVCVALKPRTSECYHNLALAQAARCDTREALTSCEQALQLQPHSPAVSLNKAGLLIKLGRHDEALVDLGRAWDDGADRGSVLYNRALVDLARGNRSGALTHLRQAAEANPHLLEARSLLEQIR